MRILGNILWFIFGGLFIFLYYCFAGVLLCITIIGIPFGIECFKLSKMALLPFGREIFEQKQPASALSVIMNILWLLFFGIEIALTHLFFAAICAITIIGIPFAKQHLKLIALAISPFGKEIRKTS